MEKQYEINVTRYAEQSMREIASYIAIDLQVPETAIKWLLNIQAEIEKLNTFPNRIHLTPEEPWHSMGVHRMLVGDFYVYFWVDEEHSRVQITDVTYVKRQQRKRLMTIPMDEL